MAPLMWFLLSVALISPSFCSYSLVPPAPACPDETVTWSVTTVCNLDQSDVVVIDILNSSKQCLVNMKKNDTCGPNEEFTTQLLKINDTCYNVTNSVTTKPDLNGTQISVSLNGEPSDSGKVTLIVIAPGPMTEITAVHIYLTSYTTANVTLQWAAKSEGISSYIVTDGSRQWVMREGESGFESKQFNLTVELGVDYNFTVRANYCNDHLNGPESEPYNLNVPLPNVTAKDPDNATGLRAGNSLTVFIALLLSLLMQHCI